MSDTIKVIKDSYEEIPYKSKSFTNSLPERVSAVLKILDFDAPDTTTARVLEIGCSFGGNILSHALANSKSELTGIDLSKIQIENGKNLMEYIGLKNINLHCMNVLDFDETLGKFDYIICHGVYSWVPHEVQDKILEIIKNTLSENGLAVISYNTYPGWKSKEVLKDIMQYRAKGLEKKGVKLSKNEKVNAGKGALEFLKEFSTLDEKEKSVIDKLLEKENYYLYHEYYEEYNYPLYLYEFNKKLEEKGLAHICDSTLQKTFPIYHNMEDIEEKLQNECGDNSVAKEQYYDFMFQNQFRTSIITHHSNKEKINISRDLKKSSLKQLNIRKKNKNSKIEMKDEALGEKVANLLTEMYPNTILVSDLVERIEGIEENRILLGVLDLIYQSKIEFYTRKMEYVKQERLNLSPFYRKYINYHFEVEHPVVSFSLFNGDVVALDKMCLYIMLKFDGEKNDEELLEHLSNDENFKNLFVDNKVDREGLKKLIEEIRVFIEAYFLNV